MGLLREMGCGMAQENYFWGALPAEAAGGLLAAYKTRDGGAPVLRCQELPIHSSSRKAAVLCPPGVGVLGKPHRPVS